jgi:hypothetical protein
MDSTQESIIKYSNEILDFLLKFKKDNPEFTFSLRQRDSAQTKEVKRLESGQWFQGSNYIYVPLFKKGDNARKIKTIGFTINFDKLGNISENSISISFKSGTEKKEEIEFHQKLANYCGLELNEHNHGSKSYSDPQDLFTNLNSFITDFRNKALILLDELELREEYVINEADFQKNLNRIEDIKLNSLNKKDEIKYWVFQGSPKIYDLVGALKANAIKTWTVSAHKDKIKIGDKFILWMTGSNSGCYALGLVTSNVTNRKELDSEMDFYLKPTEQIDNSRITVEIEHNFFNNPILWNTIKDDAIFKNFKGGNQGTNFSATENEYNILLNMASNNKILDSPLNQILYGPPGTGKTYNTVLEAAKIVTGNEAISYDDALKTFNDNLGTQIEFITFHQNYSYEDFIQGIRPDTENGKELTFEKKDGVFKRIADRALENLNLSEKTPDELSKEALFDKALEGFKESILESEDKYMINETAYIFEAEKDAFRYTGEKWGYINGLRMKFVDLKEFYRNNVKSRKDVKSLTSISGLANQHATYYYLVYEQILTHLPKEIENPVKVVHKNFVMIIDEINRANISRVFGELITLIEDDKRSHGAIPIRVTLPSGDPFIVPSNLYIIGTMNTADKSIALLDIALRRRFDFVPMYPLYEGLEKPINDVEILQKINEAILSRKNHDFTIGHAYFMGMDYTLENTINKKVIPLLLEYFMNDEKEVTSILQLAGIKIGCWPLKMIE